MMGFRFAARNAARTLHQPRLRLAHFTFADDYHSGASDTVEEGERADHRRVT
jgi:hypothetical protein